MKMMLCGDRDSYPQFKDFNKWVLKPAMKEVNENTDLTIIMETSKKGRSIHALRFFVKPNDNYEDKLLVKPTAVKPPKFGEEAEVESLIEENTGDFKDNGEMADFFRNC